ncbi:hypothetical protein F5888DRAFT_1639263 [Russula emetica]|nr:hypothetical protein F5888DRAFT_1639263 [Russula emetica]
MSQVQTMDAEDNSEVVLSEVEIEQLDGFLPASQVVYQHAPTQLAILDVDLPTRSVIFLLADLEAFHRCLWRYDLNEAIGKDHPCFIKCLEFWCATDKLGELWGVEYEMMEKCYRQTIQFLRTGRGERVGGGRRRVGFPGLGKVEGIRILGKVFRASSTWRGNEPSSPVRSTRNEEFSKDEMDKVRYEKGRTWCRSTQERFGNDRGRFIFQPDRQMGLAPGMVTVSPRLFPVANLGRPKRQFDIHGLKHVDQTMDSQPAAETSATIR